LAVATTAVLGQGAPMDAGSDPEPRRSGSRWLILGAASLAFAALCVWLLRLGGLPVFPSGEQLSRVAPLHLAVFSGLYLIAVGLRIVRWRWQLRPIGAVPFGRVLSASLLGNAAVVLLPLRSGEFVRLALISRNSPIPFMAALGTAGCERLVDALTAAVLLLVSLRCAEIRDPLPEKIGDLPIHASIVPTLGYSAAGLTLAAISVVLMFFYFRNPTIRLIKLVCGVISKKLADSVERRLADLTRGLEFLNDFENAWKYLATTILYWSCHVLAVWYLLRHTGFHDCSLAQAGVVLGTVVFGASLPNAPGFFGIFQIGVYASLALFYPPDMVQDSGSVTAFWMYVLEVGWILVLAPLAFLVRSDTKLRVVV
jgi:glycosyltransferase 2 family protein